MSFLYPAFLIGALAIAIPIALHLLRRDVAPAVPFTAVRLLKRSPVDRSRHRRLRDILLLVARVAALILLAAAFARPYAPGAPGAGLRIVALDRSYSMGAPGRFERAVVLVREAIDGVSAGERVALVAFDARADVVAAPGSASDARAALEGLSAGFGTTRYAAVVEKAAELAGGAPVRLVIVTDMQRAGWESEHPLPVPSSWTIDVQDVGEARGNLAVTAVRADAEGAIASIQNTGGAVREGIARAFVDGREVGSAPFQVAPDVVVDARLSFPVPERGTLQVTVDDPEGLEADNSRYLVLGAAPRPRVLIVTSGAGTQSGFYLARALEAAGEEGGFVVRLVSGADLSSVTEDELGTYGAVVLLSTRGLDRRARDGISSFVRRGGGLFAAAAPDLEPGVLSSLLDWNPPLAPEEAAQPSRLTVTDLRHPIFRPFGALSANLGQPRFERIWKLNGAGWNVVARFHDGMPALLERSEGAGRVVLFASDVDRRWNDFPLHPAFVPFAIESVRHAAREVDTAREYTPERAPAGAGPQPGVYAVGADGRAIAVNVDIAESSLTRVSVQQFADMLPPFEAGSVQGEANLQAEQTEARQSYWQYGLLLMLAVLLVESFVGRSA